MSRHSSSRYPDERGDRYAPRDSRGLSPPRYAPSSSSSRPSSSNQFAQHTPRPGSPPRQSRDVPMDRSRDRYALPSGSHSSTASSAHDKNRYAEASSSSHRRESYRREEPSLSHREDRHSRRAEEESSSSSSRRPTSGEYRSPRYIPPAPPPLERRTTRETSDRYADPDALGSSSLPLPSRSAPYRPDPTLIVKAPPTASGEVNLRDIPGDKIPNELKQANRRESWTRKPTSEPATASPSIPGSSPPSARPRAPSILRETILPHPNPSTSSSSRRGEPTSRHAAVLPGRSRSPPRFSEKKSRSRSPPPAKKSRSSKPTSSSTATKRDPTRSPPTPPPRTTRDDSRSPERSHSRSRRTTSEVKRPVSRSPRSSPSLSSDSGAEVARRFTVNKQTDQAARRKGKVVTEEIGARDGPRSGKDPEVSTSSRSQATSNRDSTRFAKPVESLASLGNSRGQQPPSGPAADRRPSSTNSPYPPSNNGSDRSFHSPYGINSSSTSTIPPPSIPKVTSVPAVFGVPTGPKALREKVVLVTNPGAPPKGPKSDRLPLPPPPPLTLANKSLTKIGVITPKVINPLSGRGGGGIPTAPKGSNQELKKFFPGDDDDDVPLAVTTKVSSSIETLSTKGVWPKDGEGRRRKDPAPEREGDASAEARRVNGPKYGTPLPRAQDERSAPGWARQHAPQGLPPFDPAFARPSPYDHSDPRAHLHHPSPAEAYHPALEQARYAQLSPQLDRGLPLHHNAPDQRQRPPRQWVGPNSGSPYISGGSAASYPSPGYAPPLNTPYPSQSLDRSPPRRPASNEPFSNAPPHDPHHSSGPVVGRDGPSHGANLVPTGPRDHAIDGRNLMRTDTPPPRRVESPSPMLVDVVEVAPPVPAAVVLPPGPPGSLELYERLVQVGEGTYGKVYKARNIETGALVALKRIRMEAEKDGFPITAIREIKLLQSLRHPNVVDLIEMMVSRGHVYMVLEYMDHDLTGVLHHPSITFSPAHLKSLMKQLLEGLGFIHRRGVLHRDLKGSNILLGKNGELKIADFGLARFYAIGRNNDYTNRVITQWYKPPELLFGTTIYGAEVDMWGAGCIFLELFARRPVFQGQDEIHQLDVIFKTTGTPTVESWPGLPDLPWYELVKPQTVIESQLRAMFSKWLTRAGLDVAEKLLWLDPAGRPTADEALRMEYFSEDPAPVLPDILSTVKGEWHEYESKRARKRKREEGGLVA